MRSASSVSIAPLFGERRARCPPGSRCSARRRSLRHDEVAGDLRASAPAARRGSRPPRRADDPLHARARAARRCRARACARPTRAASLRVERHREVPALADHEAHVQARGRGGSRPPRRRSGRRPRPPPASPLPRLAVERLEVAQRHEVVQARARRRPARAPGARLRPHGQQQPVVARAASRPRSTSAWPGASSVATRPLHALEAHPLVEARGRRARCPAGSSGPRRRTSGPGARRSGRARPRRR